MNSYLIIYDSSMLMAFPFLFTARVQTSSVSAASFVGVEVSSLLDNSRLQPLNSFSSLIYLANATSLMPSMLLLRTMITCLLSISHIYTLPSSAADTIFFPSLTNTSYTTDTIGPLCMAFFPASL